MTSSPSSITPPGGDQSMFPSRRRLATSSSPSSASINALPTSHSRIRGTVGSAGVADHAVLVMPSANRVYAQQGPALLAAELEALNALALDGRLSDIEVVDLSGVPYVTFSGD